MIRRAAAVATLLALLLAGASAWHQLDRPVRAVRVAGLLTPAEQAAVREAVRRSLDSGLLTLDLGAVAASIEALSWPRAVAVRRRWPDALSITVEKESVVAAWGEGGYLTSAGKVVELPGGPAAGAGDVPALVASLSQPRRAMEIYHLLESRLATLGLGIERLEENEIGEWRMTLHGGTTVALGNEAITDRLQRFMTAYRRALGARRDELAHVDLRYDHGLAVRWANEPGTDYALR